MCTQLDQLPPEILSKILSFLTKDDLVQVAQVSKDSRRLCLEDPRWKHLKGSVANFRPDHFRNLKELQNGHQGHVSNRNSLKEACRIAHNWRHHRPKDYTVKKQKPKLLPWLCVDENTLFFSHTSNILSYGVRQGYRNGVDHRKSRVYRGHRKDVVRFAVTNTHVISGGRIPVDKAVVSLDASSTSIVTGIRETGIMVFGKNDVGFSSMYVYSMEDIVWTVVINPDERYFTSGSSCHKDRQPLNVFDLERGTRITTCGRDYRYGAGVLALHYQNPFTFISCGYDCSVNCWDLRDSCRLPVVSFPDEEQSFPYSVDSDLDNFVVCGLCRYGHIKFWDKRYSAKSLRSFFIGNVGLLNNSSPVYSLKMTATHLYAALSQSLQSMDFTGNLCQLPAR
ncbi:putative F-box/WD repeat-containing protein 4 [Apostichopus japonicus]|uniref:Putative F-box/WD repeat-containing protein 4 n=1 Tax=Stichopus japonicus TaxID=307972 RepID=A0A2G8L8W1_STIJA|nr:putative F-box/WD repeat-containing protein 4 [Apostichopus japonicus]